jgi:hypothetical protein
MQNGKNWIGTLVDAAAARGYEREELGFLVGVLLRGGELGELLDAVVCC